MPVGTATLDFGASGNQFTTVVVTGQAAIGSGSYAEAFMMGDTTADNNDFQHEIVPMTLTCGDIVPGTGFTIHARCDWTLFKTYSCRWVWF